MKVYILIVLTLFALTASAQTTLNAYKYVLVPEQFPFSKEDNQYGLATISKLQLEDKGFVAFRPNDPLPPALAANKCQALRLEVSERKSLFSTNLTVYLKDCQGNTIFKSREGKSREKEFVDAYPEALTQAFASLQATPYKYDSTLIAGSPQSAATPQTQQPVVNPQPQQPIATAQIDIPATTLYAQPVPNGYQLIDTTPKKVLTLLKTSVQDYFIADAGTSSGIVFKKDGQWFFEYYKEDKLISQKLEIKF